MNTQICNINEYLLWEKKTGKLIYEKCSCKDIINLSETDSSMINVSLFNVRKYVSDNMISAPVIEDALPTDGKPRSFINNFSKPVKNQKAKITRLKNKAKQNKTNDNGINVGAMGISESDDSYIDQYLKYIISDINKAIESLYGIISQYADENRSTFIIAKDGFVSKITFRHHQSSYSDYSIELQCIYGNTYDGVRETYNYAFVQKLFETIHLRYIYIAPYKLSKQNFNIVLYPQDCDETEVFNDLQKLSDWYTEHFDQFCNVHIEHDNGIDLNVIIIHFEDKKNSVYGSYSPEEMISSNICTENADFIKSYCQGIDSIQYLAMLESAPNNESLLRLGWDITVPINMKNLLEESSNTKKRMVTETVLNDNTLFKNNRVYNIDDFMDGTQNFLLITGFSGSGKSTLSYQISEDIDSIVIELDMFHNYEYAKIEYPNDPCVKIIKKYLKETKKKAKDFPTSIEQNNFEDTFVPFFKWLIKDISKDTKNKYIIEGIQIFLFVPYKTIKKYPLICVETNKYKSLIRRWIWDEWNIKDVIQFAKNDIEMYNRHSKIYTGVKSQLDKNPSKDTTSDKYPIFIVCSYTGTPFGKVIGTYTRSQYTHASISLDTSMEKLYSFNGDNKTNKLGGFSEEKLSEYVKYNEDAKVKISCMFIKRRDLNIIKNKLDYFLSHKKETTYSFANIWNIIRNKSIEMGGDATSMVCSQFVTYLLQQADIEVLDKSPNLVTPKDLSSVLNPKLYLLFEGYARNYDKRKIDRIFKKMKIQAQLIKESMDNIL